MSQFYISQHQIKTFQRDGVILIKGLFHNYVDKIRLGIERNLIEPGQYGEENLNQGEKRRFFDDYCNWQRIPELNDLIFRSSVGTVAAQLMKSRKIQLFHEHVLVKEPGTTKQTPWHQDSPYYFVEGTQTVSFWSSMDRVTNASLRCVAGSHKWEKLVLSTKWLNKECFYRSKKDFITVPDRDLEKMEIIEWDMELGDAVAFDFKKLHGARGNTSNERRRAFSLRLVGDDVRYIGGGEQTSPPFPNHGMISGDKLREDWFPIIFSN